MNSFNVYGQTEERIGGNTPVWLGTVKPIPVGGTNSGSEGTMIKAGSVCIYDPVSKQVTKLPDDLSGGQAASMLPNANAYVYNDIYITEDGADYTCAVVMHHPEGLMIERVYPEITEEQIAQLQSQIPGVLLVRG